MWKHTITLFSLVLVVALLSNSPSTSAQSTYPRLSINDIIGGIAGQPVGARMPLTSSNGQWWDKGSPTAITYDATSGTIYASNVNSYVAQISLPTMVNSSNINALPYVSFIEGQGFYDPIEGKRYEADGGGANPASLWGLLVTPDRLYGTHSISYDASNSQVKSHWSRPKTLPFSNDVKGLDQFWDGHRADLTLTRYTGFTSGYLFRVPSEWQSSFGGRTMGSGQCCQSIIWRNSFGPAAGVFNPADIGSGLTEPHDWQPLVYYPESHPTLGCWECQGNPYFGYTTSVRAAVMINNTRTMAFFGRQGKGPICYGVGTSDPELHGDEVPGGQGEIYCYDPTNNDKANHQYPYVYFIWLYDINHLVEVYNLTRNPWDAIPYDGAEFDFPVVPPSTGIQALRNITGADYDPATRSLYLVQSNVDKIEPCCNVASLLWKFTVNIPSGSSTVTNVSLRHDRSTPQPVNTTITWTAQGIGGVSPLQYKFWVQDPGGTWTVTENWSTANTFAWTPTTAGAYSVAVWARSAGNTVDYFEASAQDWYTITNP